jgi:hypothetical protein
VPVDPAIRTTHMGRGIFECVVGPDPWSALSQRSWVPRKQAEHMAANRRCKEALLLVNPANHRAAILIRKHEARRTTSAPLTPPKRLITANIPF